MKARLAAFAIVLVAAPVAAHDFWIQPTRFQVATNSPFPLTLQVGHGAARQRWGLGLDRIVLLRAFGPGKPRDLKPDFLSEGTADLSTRFTTDGLHAIVLQSTSAQSELPAIRFNDYVKAEGLTPILQARQRTGKTDTPGRERYSRRAKALVQVGSQTAANQSVATKALGLKLEIVAERNPYTLDASRMLPVHVLYKGRPLPGATVKLTSLEFDAKPIATAVTDARGRASFRVPATGEWLLNVLWSEPVTDDLRVDFDTTFSSLTWGYDPAFRRR